MDKNTELTLRRNRSIQAVIRDGFRLYGQYFSRLLRSSWIQAIIYALVTGLSMAYFFTYLLPPLMSDYHISSKLLIWLGTIVAFLIAAILFAFAGGVAPLHDHSLTDNIRRPQHWWGRWPWKLTFKGLTKLPRMLWKAIRSHQLGTLIVVSLIMLLLVIIVMLLLMMPAVIMGIANVEAAAGWAAGDEVDMPDNLFMLNFAIFSVCGFLQAYIHLTTLFPLYYIWGNVLMKNKK